MKTRNIITTIASITTRAIIGGAIGYAVGTAIDRIRTNIALKKSIEDAANDPHIRRVPVETIDLDEIPDYADPDELPSFSEILRNTEAYEKARYETFETLSNPEELADEIEGMRF